MFEAIGPGPFAAMLLADLGADVIRVDRPAPPGPVPAADVLGRTTVAQTTPEAFQLSLLAGMLRIGALQPDGSATLLACIEPYQWLGEVSLMDDQPRTHNAVADGESSVLVVPQAALRAWLDANPAQWRDIGRLACSKLRAAFTVFEHMASLPLEQRLLQHLQLLARGYGMRRGPARQHVRLTQEQLSLMLGVSRQSINKALQALERQGAISLRYGRIELLQAVAGAEGVALGDGAAKAQL